MEKKVMPIKASEITKIRHQAIPDAVIEAFNKLILKDFSAGSAKVKQDDVVSLITGKGLSRKEIFDNHWLDVEDLYRKNGWTVKYNSPCRDENFDSYFLFSIKTK